MPQRHDHLFHAIAAFSPLRSAARRAILGKRRKPGAAAFQAGLERELLRLEHELQTRSYRTGRYLEIVVKDPKTRVVSAAPFRDRVVHHAAHDVVAPLFERGFIANSFANRKGKGTHAAIRAYEGYRDRYSHVLRCDIFRYFPAIDHAILKADLRRRIRCEGTLWLLDTIIDGSNAQEAVDIHFPGDDLLVPCLRRRGLPIGNLTSQFFSNVYLDCLDHFATERLSAPYVRYVDDFALFSNDPGQLQGWRQALQQFLDRRRLVLHPVKTWIAATAQPAKFLGFELHPRGGRRLPSENVQRFANRLRSLCDKSAGTAIWDDQVRMRIRAWCAHAAHGDTVRLRRSIFKRVHPRCTDESDWGLTNPMLPRHPRRRVEQQSMESSLRQPQQEQRKQPEQQYRLPGLEHASMPELRGPRPAGARRGCVQGSS